MGAFRTCKTSSLWVQFFQKPGHSSGTSAETQTTEEPPPPGVITGVFYRFNIKTSLFIITITLIIIESFTTDPTQLNCESPSLDLLKLVFHFFIIIIHVRFRRLLKISQMRIKHLVKQLMIFNPQIKCSILYILMAELSWVYLLFFNIT